MNTCYISKPLVIDKSLCQLTDRNISYIIFTAGAESIDRKYCKGKLGG